MLTHKQLDVYKLSIDLVTKIYRISSGFPKEELFGLVSQIRRAAVSIPSNIAEGSARKHKKDYVRFLYISLGSAAELETQFLIAFKLGYISEEQEKGISEKINSISRMIQGMIRHNSPKSNPQPPVPNPHSPIPIPQSPIPIPQSPFPNSQFPNPNEP